MPITFAPLGRTRYFRHDKRWYRVVYEGKSRDRAVALGREYKRKGYDVVGLTSNGKLTVFAKAAFDLPESREYGVGVWKSGMRFRW